MLSRMNSRKAKPPVAVPAKRFELPALEFKFGSLTEGTDIPPPPPSPPLMTVGEESVPTPPETPNGDNKKDTRPGHLQLQTATARINGDLASPKSYISRTSTGAVKRSAEDYPASPALSSRQGSIRRLFGRSLLHNTYANGGDEQPPSPLGDSFGPRPDSRGGASIIDGRKVKRPSGWFSRLRSSDNGSKRTSITLASPPLPEESMKGPPPPMIPELSKIKSELAIQEDDSFGSDLFKNIK